ncbi:MAG: sigma factor-like helix-turn-helix DNA-binding protein [Nannocystaceae bacterium]
MKRQHSKDLDTPQKRFAATQVQASIEDYEDHRKRAAREFTAGRILRLERMKTLESEGMTRAWIARQYGISRERVRQILKGET